MWSPTPVMSADPYIHARASTPWTTECNHTFPVRLGTGVHTRGPADGETCSRRREICFQGQSGFKAIRLGANQHCQRYPRAACGTTRLEQKKPELLARAGTIPADKAKHTRHRRRGTFFFLFAADQFLDNVGGCISKTYRRIARIVGSAEGRGAIPWRLTFEARLVQTYRHARPRAPVRGLRLRTFSTVLLSDIVGFGDIMDSTRLPDLDQAR
jgi:hypothetical protein